jgi:DNA repair exonuclease SbcCD ATPase subunit
MATPRLTEEDVHEACAELAGRGERPTALTLLQYLGRGSLTTITKHLNSWNATDEAKAIGVEALPAVVELPSELVKDGEGLIKRIWAVAKGLADEELDIQREALRQAEIANQAKVEEAFKFSEAQAQQIEQLDDAFMSLKKQLDDAHAEWRQASADLLEAQKTIVAVSKDNDQLRHEISDLRSQLAAAAQEKQALLQKHETALGQKDAELRSLDNEVHKLQASLASTGEANDQLKAELKNCTPELSKRVIEWEKLNVRYQAATDELKTAKEGLKAANKTASEAEKQVAHLEGQLAVYQART